MRGGDGGDGGDVVVIRVLLGDGGALLPLRDVVLRKHGCVARLLFCYEVNNLN